MIFSIDMRTDIPAFYGEWFMNRLKAGYVMVRNPFYPEKVSRYQVTPETVDGFVFCSKNYSPFLKHLETIKNKYPILCHYTITPYGKDTEPNVPDINTSIETLKNVSKIVGKERTVWRYDPVLLTQKYTVLKHKESFGSMTEQLAPYVSKCIFSLLVPYKKTRRNMPEVILPTEEETNELISILGKTAQTYNLPLQICASPTWKEYQKIAPNLLPPGCITTEEFCKANNLILIRKDPHSGLNGIRQGCMCMHKQKAMGAYNTCPHGCKYCYANEDHKLAYERFKTHNPNSDILFGTIKDTDTVTQAKQVKLFRKNDELTLFN